ncbi:MAG: sigma-70 family RNA polymerase sigma factor [Bacteroidota bacterium]
MIHYSDYAIVEGLRLNSDFIIRYVYKEFFPAIKYFIKNNSGYEEDAEDIFQEALLVILTKIKDDDFELSSSFITYLYSICRNIWLQKLKRKRMTSKNQDELTHFLDIQDVEKEVFIENEEKYQSFIRQFEHLSGDCQKLLKLFLTKKSSKEIADHMGYKSEFYAKTKKHLCKEALKKLVENDPDLQQFIN